MNVIALHFHFFSKLVTMVSGTHVCQAFFRGLIFCASDAALSSSLIYILLPIRFLKERNPRKKRNPRRSKLSILSTLHAHVRLELVVTFDLKAVI
jgi:hypothetical protein